MKARIPQGAGGAGNMNQMMQRMQKMQEEMTVHRQSWRRRSTMSLPAVEISR